MATNEQAGDAAPLQFKLPQGGTVQLPIGWSVHLKNPGEQTYVDPEGKVYSAQNMISVALAILEKSAGGVAKKATPQIMKSLLDELGRLHEGGSQEPVLGESKAASDTGSKAGAARYHGYDQLDDWHYRGTHPILVHMPLYEYSRWAYRVEFSPFAVASAQAPRRKPRHVDIPFGEEYTLSRTWVQRLSREPRVPRIEGMKFQSSANPEMHYLLKSLLLRPVHLQQSEPITTPGEGQAAASDFCTLILLQSYQSLCTSSSGEEWKATGIGHDSPGPFERGFKEFSRMMEEPAAQALQKRLAAADYPSFWDTQEVQQELRQAVQMHNLAEGQMCDDDGCPEEDELGSPSDPLSGLHVSCPLRPTVQEYFAAEFFKIEANFDGIATAQVDAQSARSKKTVTFVKSP